MTREIIRPAGAPSNVPLSEAIKANGVVYCSGQGPVPDPGASVSADIKQQTRQVLSNIVKLLEASGSNIDQCLKLTIYLTDISKFADMNSVYREFFPTDPPARTTVGVSALPRPEWQIEIDVIALANAS